MTNGWNETLHNGCVQKRCEREGAGSVGHSTVLQAGVLDRPLAPEGEAVGKLREKRGKGADAIITTNHSFLQLTLHNGATC